MHCNSTGKAWPHFSQGRWPGRFCPTSLGRVVQKNPKELDFEPTYCSYGSKRKPSKKLGVLGDSFPFTNKKRRFCRYTTDLFCSKQSLFSSAKRKRSLSARSLDASWASQPGGFRSPKGPRTTRRRLPGGFGGSEGRIHQQKHRFWRSFCQSFFSFWGTVPTVPC